MDRNSRHMPLERMPVPIRRIGIWYMVLVCIIALFIVRAFYVQVIKYSYYHNVALQDQLKQYQIPATRGVIEAYEGNSIVPIVLNQQLYTIYADPLYIKNVATVAQTVADVLGGDPSQYEAKMKTPNTQYVVLANKVSEDLEKKLLDHHYPGIGSQAQDYRTYPQGSLASQLLGFVNNSGVGEYGIEQALNQELSGIPGEVKAVTDAAGVPLAASGNNIDVAPQAGKNVVLTINLGMQKQVEQVLSQVVQSTHGQAGTAVVMDPYTGQVKAMANYPTYDPSQYYNVSDSSVFENMAVDDPIEVGSIMKTLTTSAALDLGVIQPDTTFYDPAHWLVDGFNITDIEQDGGARQQSIASLLNLSLNTGATWELMQMGGGQINAKARNSWYDYMSNRFQLGKETGIEQGYEATGYVPGPQNNGAGINLTYANTSFGQGMTATALQMSSALSSVLNGGTYYKPTLVSETIDPNTGKATPNQPQVVKKNVVSSKIGPELMPLMEYVVQQHYLAGYSDMNFSSNYTVGGKTGTAQITQPGGGYYSDIYNGTYIGFVGGDKVQYVIVDFVKKPTSISGYAGVAAGQPVFAGIAHMLINDAYVTPKS